MARRPYGMLTEQEKKEIPALSWAFIKRMASYFKPFCLPLVAIIILEAVTSSVNLIPQIITRRIVDDALLGRNLTLLIQLLGLSMAFAIGNFFLNDAGGNLNSWMSGKMTINMKNQIFRKLIYMDYDYFKNENKADIRERITEDVSEVIKTVTNIIPDIVSDIAVLVVALTAMGSVDYRLVLIGLCTLPMEILPLKFSRKIRYQNHEKVREKGLEIKRFLEETLTAQGSLLIKLFTKEEEKCAVYNRLQEECFALERKNRRVGKGFSLINMIFNRLSSLLVYLLAGILMLKQENSNVTIGSITMTLVLCQHIMHPVHKLLNCHVDLARGISAFDRISKILDKENKIIAPENGIEEKVCEGDIQFKNVNFSYKEGEPILRDVSFTIPASKTIALVGPSGAGKSSLINLISRLYSTDSGEISIGGKDISDIDLKYLRSNIGVVTQDSFLINGTIKENLLYAKENATQEEMETVCINAGIHDFISSLPLGYETEVGENGLKLSGGQRQRLSIARVLLKNPRILILDEATSSLDSKTENAISEALDILMEGRTSVIIAHRLSTILKADQILVLADGEIKERGTHYELLEKNGIYRELYENQFRKVLDMESGTAA